MAKKFLNGINTDYVDFNSNSPSSPIDKRIQWSDDDETLLLGLNPDTIHKIGQETLFLVKNQTGITIPKGAVVGAVGTIGTSGRILIQPFLANGTQQSKFLIGVTSENILDGTDGFVTAFGSIRQINTSEFPDGTILYSSPTIAGGFTSIPPTAPNNIITVAIVIKSDINNGSIFVRPTFGSNINDDEGVKLTNPEINDALVYDGNFWVNGLYKYVINNENNQLLERRDILKFNRLIVEDDSINEKTIVTRPPSIIKSETAPSFNNLIEGDEWVNITNWKRYIYYDGYWVEIGVASSSGVISAAGSNTEIQYNNNGDIDASNDFTWNNTTKKLSVNGILKVKSLNIDYQENLSVNTGGDQIIAIVDLTNINTIFFEFVIIKLNNIKAGLLMVATDGININFTETSTNDLGDTTDVTLSADIFGGNIRLIANTLSNDWIIKTNIRSF